MHPKFRTKYDRREIVSPHGGKSMTDQQYKDECSIDGIIKRYGVMQQPLPQSLGTGMDVSDYQDFATNMNRVIEAKNRFLELPSEIRERFGHSPEAFYNWLGNKENHDEAVKLGLFNAPAPQVKDPVEILERIADAVTSKEGNGAQ